MFRSDSDDRGRTDDELEKNPGLLLFICLIIFQSLLVRGLLLLKMCFIVLEWECRRSVVVAN